MIVEKESLNRRLRMRTLRERFRILPPKAKLMALYQTKEWLKGHRQSWKGSTLETFYLEAIDQVLEELEK